EQLRRLEYEVIRGFAAGSRERPAGRKCEFRSGRQAEAVGTVGECDDAFEVVIAIDAAPNHPKGQIDLGAPGLDQRLYSGSGMGFKISSFNVFTTGHSEC